LIFTLVILTPWKQFDADEHRRWRRKRSLIFNDHTLRVNPLLSDKKAESFELKKQKKLLPRVLLSHEAIHSHPLELSRREKHIGTEADKAEKTLQKAFLHRRRFSSCFVERKRKTFSTPPELVVSCYYCARLS
jgi:hypothetical protein